MANNKTINFNRIYTWMLVDRFLNNPDDTTIKTKFIDFLETELIFEDIKNTLKNNEKIDPSTFSLFEGLKLTLEAQFKLQFDHIESKNNCLKELEEGLNSLNKLQIIDIPEESATVVGIIREFAVSIQERILKKEPQQELGWGEYSLYLLAKNYLGILKDAKLTDNNFPDLKIFFNFYTELTKVEVIPIFVIPEKESINIETTIFSEEIPQKILNLLNIKIPITDKPYIITSIGNEFMKDPLLLPLFASEIGILIDKTYIKLESHVISKFMYDFPGVFMSLNKDNMQWIPELISDSIALCLAGPSYLFALIKYMKEEEFLHATTKHPSINFRASVMYTYLFQNEFISLLSPNAFKILQKKLKYYQKHYTTGINTYSELEQVLQNYVSFIYYTIMEFLQNTGAYSSYYDLAELICTNEGSLEKTQKALMTKRQTFKDLMNLQNINWLIETRKDKGKSLN